MTTQIGCELGSHDEVSDAFVDGRCAAGTDVTLPRLVWLDGRDDLVTKGTVGDRHGGYPKKPHATTTSASAAKPTTRAMSTAEVRCLRNGLKPMAAW